MKILSIGDIHGRDSWKFLTHGSPYEYNSWRAATDHGAPHESDFWKDLPFMSYDKIIFVGDYVDSFDIENVVMKNNLLEIIHFKKALGDKVVLLLGNHDVHYIVPNQECSGFRSEMRYDFGQIFNENLQLFTLAYEFCKDDSKWLWTHAGVTSGWLKDFRNDLYSPKFRFHEIVSERKKERELTLSEEINLAWELEMKNIYYVDHYSGGMNSWAGPLWVRPTMLNYWPLEGWNQIVGHTASAYVYIVNSDKEGKEFVNFSHYFIDCLDHVVEGLDLEL